MAILKGFPPSNCISPGGPHLTADCFQVKSNVRYNKPFPASLPQELEAYWPVARTCPKVSEHLKKQTERVRSALVVYALNVMDELGIEPTPETMQDCIDIGEEMYAAYKFEKDGPYGDFIQSHLRRLLQEKDYFVKVVSRSVFG